jgi:hypothetical protein
MSLVSNLAWTGRALQAECEEMEVGLVLRICIRAGYPPNEIVD